MATMPKTALLLVSWDRVIGTFDKYSDIARYIGISCSDEGLITFGEKLLSIQYNMEDYTKESAIIDFARNEMSRQLKTNFVIYRFLT